MLLWFCPNAHMGPSGAEALVIPTTRSDQCPLTPLHWDHIPTKKKKLGKDVLILPQSAGLWPHNVQPQPSLDTSLHTHTPCHPTPDIKRSHRGR